MLLIGPGLEYYVLRVTRFLRGASTRAIADRLWASRTSRLLKSYAWAGRVVVSRVDVLAHLASGHKHDNTPDKHVHKRVPDFTRSSPGFLEIPSGHASPTNNAIRHRTSFLPARVSLSLTVAIRFLTGPFLTISTRNELASSFHDSLLRGWVFLWEFPDDN